MNSRPTTETRLRRLDTVPYRECWSAMQAHNRQPPETRRNEIWLVEHPPVFTQGLAGRPEHLLDAGTIPVIKTDRGGQITYHGPGQLVLYLMLELRPLSLSVKGLVNTLEEAIISLLSELGLAAERRPGAPGVYIEGAKIAALGLRVRGGATYHGLSFNYAMDLSPFNQINPCGYPGMAVTQLADLITPLPARETLEQTLLTRLAEGLRLELTTADAVRSHHPHG
ncbi:MAG: lipoyl(octanoyl) transferase LipB [Gammaproteobacteria bacterium]|nr:lipoyl(octanoyl) transferase LipB [Gammaproteobacteria bacterium]